MKVRIVLTSLMISLATGSGAEASYAVYVGKNLTRDGSVFLAGYGDEPSSHWLEIVPRRKHAPGSTLTVGATPESRYPGELIEIPQVPTTFRYLTMNYSYFAGFPAPLTNGGLNEHGVAARDVSSSSRIELREMTPNPQRGPNYSDLSRIVMERARSAREAVEIVGELIAEYGFSTYGGNSHLFADAEEGWVLINFAGGQGLWVAERMGPDDIRVSRPGYIHEVPLNYREHPDFMGSRNLISFAVERGWYDPESGEPFHVGKVYGRSADRAEAVQMIEDRLRSRAGRIGLQDMIEVVRTPELTRDSAGYGQVAHLRQGRPSGVADLVGGAGPSRGGAVRPLPHRRAGRAARVQEASLPHRRRGLPPHQGPGHGGGIDAVRVPRLQASVLSGQIPRSEIPAGGRGGLDRLRVSPD